MINQKEDFQNRLVKFSLNIIELCDSFPNKRKFWIITDQLIRAATSIGANIVEAKSSSSRKDYIKFFQIALKSANETEYWLILTKELVHDVESVDHLLGELREISCIIASSLLTLKGKKHL
jgi:four helix bundle protein